MYRDVYQLGLNNAIARYKVKGNHGLTAAESTQAVTNGCTPIQSDLVNGRTTIIASGLTAAGSTQIIMS
jgi:hypothetical protein